MGCPAAPDFAANSEAQLTRAALFGNLACAAIDLADPAPETPAMVADRIRAGLKHVLPENLVPAPDCGMKYLPRELAFAKLKALAEGAAMVRAEVG